ncbi:hypothetical protein M885DRAFT_562297 [Pelagophyceae sp. CCMP2097]|nr:hypothetical protein M885DRAFT_562297 [Pelagophyceae sp. CCMP2097]
MLHSTRRLLTSRLRQLADDALLITGNSQRSAGDSGVDPTILVAEAKISEAQRRGVFEGLKGEGKPLEVDAHRDTIRQFGSDALASYTMAKTLAANDIKPPSIELRLEVESSRAAFVALAQPLLTILSRQESAELISAGEQLSSLIKRQHAASISDAIAFGSQDASPLMVRGFDFHNEIKLITTDKGLRPQRGKGKGTDTTLPETQPETTDGGDKQ